MQHIYTVCISKYTMSCHVMSISLHMNPYESIWSIRTWIIIKNASGARALRLAHTIGLGDGDRWHGEMEVLRWHLMSCLNCRQDFPPTFSTKYIKMIRNASDGKPHTFSTLSSLQGQWQYAGSFWQVWDLPSPPVHAQQIFLQYLVYGPACTCRLQHLHVCAILL